MKKADLVIDLQFGSTGKGLIAGYLAMQNKYDVVVTANMPNAGHTFIDGEGNKMVHKVLPNGIVSPNLRYVLIGPGAVFSEKQLIKEIVVARMYGYMRNCEILIHPNATILQDSHTSDEQHMVGSIGSTAQGSAAAMIAKINRNPNNNPTAMSFMFRIEQYSRKDHINIRVTDWDTYRAVLDGAESILLEGAQGYSLGINQQFYPFCTSRECTPSRFLSDMGVPLGFLRDIVGTARVHPIRVGGNSGDYYDDQTELSWDEVGVEAETTTVTGRIRRVFSYSRKQIEDAIWETQPTKVFLNFCNYDEAAATNVVDHINSLRKSENHQGLVTWLGWGPTVNDVELAPEYSQGGDVEDGRQVHRHV